MMKLFFKLILSVLLIVVCVVLWGRFWHWFTKEPEFTAEEWKAMSIKEASRQLDQYIKQEGLNRKDFKGPYTYKTDNPDPPFFDTYYKSDEYHFYYSQGGDRSDGYAFNGDCKGYYLCEWLIKQP